MNSRALQVAVILIISLALLTWIRSDGRYDFDIRSVLPFLRGSKVSLHDFAGLAVILLGVRGLARMRRAAADEPSASDSEYDTVEDTQPVDDESVEGKTDEHDE